MGETSHTQDHRAGGPGALPHPLALPAVAVAAALWAVGGVVASSLFDAGVSPFELAGARALLSALGLALVPAARRGGGPGSTRQLVALGIGIAGVNGTYYLAIDRLPVAVAIVLQYTGPALVVTWAALRLHRPPGRALGAAVGGAMAGVVLVTGVGAQGVASLDPVGVLMGFGAAVFFAVYTLLSERARRSFGALGALLRGFAVATAIWMAVLIPGGWPGSILATENLIGVLFVSLGGTLAPFLLYVWAIAHVKAERASIAATLEPVLAAAFAWMWLGQSLTATQVLGGALVVVAVIVVQLAPPPRAE